MHGSERTVITHGDLECPLHAEEALVQSGRVFAVQRDQFQSVLALIRRGRSADRQQHDRHDGAVRHGDAQNYAVNL